MRLFAHRIPSGPRLGYETAEGSWDLADALGSDAGPELVAAVATGQLAALFPDLLRDPALRSATAAPGRTRLDRPSLALLPPVVPRTLIGVGRNYGAHADEGGLERQEKPRLFVKLASSVIGHGAPIPRPAGITKLDFEAELGVVIGRTAKSVSRARALDHVAGYVPLNDISARELQFDVTPGQTSLAKSMDGFCPLGPAMLVAEADVDPAGFTVRCTVNGETMQTGHTSDLIFDVPCLIEYVTRYLTLSPGDVIATGTPAGVGHFRDPPVYLGPGDTVAVEIDGIGRLENVVTEGA